MLEHTYASASKSTRASEVIVATDHEEIAEVVRGFGGKAVMTDSSHVCGTDRIAEVAESLSHFDLVVNVQGDEPEISADAIDLAISLLEQNADVAMSTLATPIRDLKSLNDPNCVKVVCDANSRALYFSRSPIPFVRDSEQLPARLNPSNTGRANFLQHVGLYGYRREYLLTIPALPPAPAEQMESLEQLRVLFNGDSILVGIIDHPIAGIDTAEDYKAFVRRHSN